MMLFLMPLLSLSQVPGLHLREGKSVAIIPFTTVNNLLLITSVTQTDSFVFILDTGVKNTILFPRDETHLQIDPSRYVYIRGIAEDDEIRSRIAYQLPVDFGNYEGILPQVLLPEFETNPLQEHFGRKIDGILGSEFFLNYCIDINFNNQIIKIKEQAKPKRKYRYTKVELIENKPYIQAGISGSDDVQLLLDLGASHPLLLELDSGKTPTNPYIINEIGTGIGGVIMGYQSRIPSLEIGGYVLEDVIANYSQEYAAAGKKGNDTRVGSVGMEILRRFNMLIDYRNSAIYLQKNVNFHSAFRCNQAGVSLLAKGPDLRIFYISYLVPGSPAAQAGLQVDDILLNINGVSSKDWELSEILHLFETDTGKRVSLEILRNQEKLNYEFKLQRLF